MYIKALEQEVLRLKETFGTTSRERDHYAEENRRLKELLMAHGIAFDSLASPPTGMARDRLQLGTRRHQVSITATALSRMTQ
jgi:hypothetical protein